MYQTYLPIVREALKNKAPSLHAQLQKSGQLEAFVEERAAEIQESVDLTRSRLIDQRKALSKTDHLRKVQDLAEIDRTAREAVLAELLEFPIDVDSAGRTG